MPELSNLLRQRLAETKNSPAQTHPDADTLTAYTEQSLPPKERQAVVGHLSICEPCREVVALSQIPPPEAVVQTVLAPAPVSAWRRLLTPAFGLGAAVAAMAIIAVLVLQLPQKHSQEAPNQQASNYVANPQAANQPAQEPRQEKASSTGDQMALAAEPALPASKPLDAKSSSSRERDVVSAAKEARHVQRREEATRANMVAGLVVDSAPPPPARTLALTAAGQKKDYVNTNFFTGETDNAVLGSQSNNLPATPQPQPSVPTNAFSTSNNGKITIFADLPANAAGKSNVRVLTPVPPQGHSSCTVCKIVGAGVHTLHLHPSGLAPAFRSNTLGSSAIGGNGMFSSALAKNQSVEASAAPEKSETSGLAASDALSPGAMSASGSRYATSPTWKVVGGKLLKSSDQSQWEEAYPTAGFEFSFVNARGHDVWAGGSHASVIHSRDGGVTWENVRLGEAATGTVQGIVAGSANVQIKTSDNQVWSSSDGGKTWTMTND